MLSRCERHYQSSRFRSPGPLQCSNALWHSGCTSHTLKRRTSLVHVLSLYRKHLKDVAKTDPVTGKCLHQRGQSKLTGFTPAGAEPCSSAMMYVYPIRI